MWPPGSGTFRIVPFMAEWTILTVVGRGGGAGVITGFS